VSDLIERLADLTGFRDRDVLDVTLVGALRDLLQPAAVAVYRCIGHDDDLRWITRARLVGQDISASADSLWAPLEDLPTLDVDAQRERCLREQTVIVESGAVSRTHFPLGSDRGPIGVIEIERARPLDEAEMRVVAGVARIYRNFLGLLDYSERDTLTGLLNRKTFDDSFMKTANGRPEVREGQSEASTAYWLGVIDIDHFKQVNDRFGHLIGDEVLLLLARLLRSTFRVHDRLYRFGGEEFVVLIRCQGEAEAQIAFERLRSNVAAYVFPQVGHITVSVGFTPVRQGDSPAAAFARADRAVYHAKAVGRDRVVSHRALVTAGLVEDVAVEGGIELF
jgi:diguanylate cyclase (GGDEF)-like protein